MLMRHGLPTEVPGAGASLFGYYRGRGSPYSVTVEKAGCLALIPAGSDRKPFEIKLIVAGNQAGTDRRYIDGNDVNYYLQYH
jgi:hypothetical protein